MRKFYEAGPGSVLFIQVNVQVVVALFYIVAIVILCVVVVVIVIVGGGVCVRCWFALWRLRVSFTMALNMFLLYMLHNAACV